MAESAPVSSPGIQRRRSSRVVQAVPITVAGVDALGRAFQERTSTQSINCHGARFHSKHYVLKNTWMVVEAPSEEGSEEPTRVRARVMWVQRPRTVRDLFQVSVELEAPGNVWGIAFPPEDWFEASQILASGLEPPTEIRPLSMTEGEATLELIAPKEPVEEIRRGPRLAAVEPATHASEERAEIFDGVIEEARERLEHTAREAAERSVAHASARLVEDLNSQVSAAAKRAVEGAASEEAEAALRRAMAELKAAREAAVTELREGWAKEFEEISGAARRQLQEQMGEALRAAKAEVAAEVAAERARAAESSVNISVQPAALDAAAARRLQAFEQQIAQTAEEARRVWMERIQGQAEQARLHLTELEQATRSLDRDIAAATADLQTGWRQRLTAEMSAAEHLWNSHLELSIVTAAQKAAERLHVETQEAGDGIRKEMESRMAAARQELEQVTAETEKAAEVHRGKLGQETFWAKAALAELEQAETRLEGHSAKIEAAGRRIAQEFEQRLAEQGEANQAKLDTKFEANLKKLTARLEPAVEAAAPAILERMAKKMEAQLDGHLNQARGVTEQLGAARAVAEEALREYNTRLQQASDEAARSASAALQELAAGMGKEMDQLHRSSLERAKEELEGQASDIRHTTFEALYNSSEWYQKKSLNQIQAALEKSLEQAAASLREKAAESSRLFAGEIERCTRSYVEHAQGILSDGAGELLQKTQAELSAATETASGVLVEEARRIQAQTLEEIGVAAHESSEAAKSQMEGAARQAAARIAAQAAISTTEFETQIIARTDEAVGNAREAFSEKLTALSGEWIARRETQEKLSLERLEKLADETGNDIQMYGSDARTQLEQLRSETASEIRREREEGTGELRALRAAAMERLESMARGASEGVKNAGDEAATQIGTLASESAAELAGMREESVRRVEGLGRETVVQVEGLARTAAEEVARLSAEVFGRMEQTGAAAAEQLGGMKREALGEIGSVREESLHVLRTTANDAEQRVAKLRDEATGEVTRAADQSVEQYRERLENVANSWLVTAVTTLDQQSKQVLESVAGAAEDRMRKTVASLFGQVAESMKAKLMGVAEELEPGKKAAEQS